MTIKKECIIFDEIPYWYFEITMPDGNILWIGEERIENVLQRYKKYDPEYGEVAKWLEHGFDWYVPVWLVEQPDEELLLKILDQSPLGEKYKFSPEY